MSPSRRPLARYLLAAAALVLGAGLLAPLLSADRFRGRIRRALVETLKRDVEAGQVRITLLTGPGFSISDVVLHEDPAFGVEPFAYVSSLEASLSWMSLLAGRLEFSSLRLVEPSVNLVKRDAGWNIQAFVSATQPALGRRLRGLPAVQVRSGRLNFKSGDLKSVFYFANADVDVHLEPGQASFRFVGEPARTDRPAQGFGRLRGRGRWNAAPARLEMDLELERSAIGELVRLIHGHDVGFHGYLASRARISGSASQLDIGGKLLLQDVHRWDLLPKRGESWPVSYQGKLDLLEQRLALETVPDPGQSLPLAVRLRASSLFSGPVWSVVATLRDLPLAPLAEVARHFGARMPERFLLDGRLEGAVGFSSPGSFQGRATLRKGSLALPETAPLALDGAEFVLGGGVLRLLPLDLELARGQRCLLEGSLRLQDWQLDARVATRGARIPDLKAFLAGVAGPAPLTILEDCSRGNWRGALRYSSSATQPGQWSGDGDLSGAELPFEGLRSPVRISSAHFSFRGPQASLSRIKAAAGDLPFEGDYRYLDGAPRPHRFRVSLSEAGASQLERLLLSPLSPQEGLIQRTLRLVRGARPEWLLHRHAEASFGIGSLRFDGFTLHQVGGRLLWDAEKVEFKDLDARWEQARIQAEASLNLAGAAPVYRLKGSLDQAPWHGALWRVEAELRTSGLGPDLARNLRASGLLETSAPPLPAALAAESLSASFELSLARGRPLLKLPAVDLETSAGRCQGKGASQSDGKFALDLQCDGKDLRISGALSPLELELAAPPPKP